MPKPRNYAPIIGGALIFALVVYFAHQFINQPRYNAESLDEQIERGRKLCNEGQIDNGVNVLLQAATYAHRMKMNDREAYAHFYAGAFQLKALKQKYAASYAKSARTGETFRLPTTELDEPEKHLRLSIELDTTFAEAHRLLAYVYREKGMLHKAMRELKEAIERNDRFAEAHNDLGEVYYALRQYDKAREYYENAIQLNEELASAHFNLGLFYATDATRETHNQSIQRARKHLKKFIELAKAQNPPPPDIAIAQQTLDAIGKSDSGDAPATPDSTSTPE